MRFRKILCPIDFSACSRQALRAAARLANEHGAELELVHVWYLPATLYAGDYVPDEAIRQIEREAARALDGALAEAKGLGAQRVGSKLLNGVPWRTIVDAASDPSIDLVVAGTHGRTGLARVILGSVAQRIVRHAPCSVMVVRPEGGLGPFDHVLCAIDVSDPSRHAMELAGALARPGGKGVALLHVLEVPAGYSNEPHPPAMYRELDRRSAALLDKCASELQAKVQVPIETRLRVGYPGAETLDALDADRTFDLVVTGSHGRTGIQRMLVGSVAEKVVSHARCAVLVARERAQEAASASPS
jgi:nucleotide-binding universal stress UspA family protein